MGKATQASWLSVRLAASVTGQTLSGASVAFACTCDVFRPAHTVTNTDEPDCDVLASKNNAFLTRPVVSAYACTVSRSDRWKQRQTNAARLPGRGLSGWVAVKINKVGQRTKVATSYPSVPSGTPSG